MKPKYMNLPSRCQYQAMVLMRVSSLAAENSWRFHFHAKEIPLKVTSRKIEQVILSSHTTNADNCNLLFSILKEDIRILVFLKQHCYQTNNNRVPDYIFFF